MGALERVLKLCRHACFSTRRLDDKRRKVRRLYATWKADGSLPTDALDAGTMRAMGGKQGRS